MLPQDPRVLEGVRASHVSLPLTAFCLVWSLTSRLLFSQLLFFHTHRLQ